MKLPYEVYLDKVYGAWLGKSIAGTIGAPFEGRKELFDYTYDPKAIEQMLPNDDLDLQVVWLHVLEQKGIYCTSMDLADAFYHLYPYVPGEYAVFKKNYIRGIYPPVSGAFNNRYYINGMGCPIRSEIWACICPGNPDLAAEYAGKDGVLDHEGDSVYAEQFLAAVEAMAFFEGDIRKLLSEGMRFLPEGTRIRRLVEDTVRWSGETGDWRKTRSRIIRDYGHPDCTNLYQNIGFTLVALLYGEGDFIETTMIALNCGFDTDCSCATAGAMLGIISGAEHLIAKHGFYDTSYKLDARVTRRSNQLKDLAEDTCRVGLTVHRELNRAVDIEGVPAFEPVPTSKPEPGVSFAIDYRGIPVAKWNETKTVSVKLRNDMSETVSGTLVASVPAGWQANWNRRDVQLTAGEEKEFELAVTVPATVEVLRENNRLTFEFAGFSASFGMNGAQIWKVYGPFWENHLDLPRTELGEWYYAHIEGAGPDEIADVSRQFHLNTKADPTKAYIPEPGTADAANEGAAEHEYVVANVTEDLFSVSDLIGFQGPCVVYAIRDVYSAVEQEVNLLFGHTDGYKLWLNGELVSEASHTDWWTAENRHVTGLRLRQGRNQIMLKCVRTGKSAEYSLVFTNPGTTFPHHVDDLGSYSGIMSPVQLKSV